ncbi:hypothetical protein CRG98_015272 [Punica granatum]|uniref:Uncharacterized protein n=1 Tax=Punica granatum TaxID=22663 RepID=A0A2I0K706_PUNGR|nr:hypothetical protein CRG98_015272 [Punica granatum]
MVGCGCLEADGLLSSISHLLQPLQAQCHLPPTHAGAPAGANSLVPSNATIVAPSTAPNALVTRSSRQREECESSAAGQKKKKARIDTPSRGRRMGLASRGMMVVASERPVRRLPALATCTCPLNWTVMEDSSIEEFKVPSQLREFISLSKDKQ